MVRSTALHMGGAFQAAGGKQQAGSKQHAVRNANQVHACLCVIRNKREVLAANVGGFQGAQPRGEFAFLTENHSGVSGPRGELWHMMEWLSVVSPTSTTTTTVKKTNMFARLETSSRWMQLRQTS